MKTKSIFRQPTWLRPFIEEPNVEVEFVSGTKRHPPYFALVILGFSIIGLVCQLLIIPSIVPTILWSLAIFYSIIVRPRTASCILLVIFGLLFSFYAIFLSATQFSELKDVGVVLGIIDGVLSLISICVLVNMPLRDPRLSRDGISQPFTEPTNTLRSPEDNLTLWQWMSVSWMAPLLRIGNKRQLNDEDVWFLGYEFQHSHLYQAFRELKGSVVLRLLRANWIDLVILTFLAFVELAANYSGPMLLQQLLQAMEVAHQTSRPAMTFALLILITRLVAAQSGVFSLWFARRCYERSRGELLTMLHEKTLNRKIAGGSAHGKDEKIAREADELHVVAEQGHQTEPSETQGLLNGIHKKTKSTKSIFSKGISNVQNSIVFIFGSGADRAKQDEPASMGKILNVMRYDIYEVAQRFWEAQKVINQPFGFILSLVLIWRLIGWSCLLGVALLLVGQALNVLIARILLNWEYIRRGATDVRLQKTSQYIEAIRHLRWYSWHPTWLSDIMKARQQELNLRIVTFMLNSLIRFINLLTGGLLPVLAFYAYTEIAGEQLRVDVAFPAMALFFMLETNLRDIPDLIRVFLNAAVAVNRIEGFMNEPDKEDVINPAGSEDVLELKQASFAWPGLSENVLHSINLSFPTGLTVVFGAVAAGKSALLKALLGELDLREGTLIKPDAAVGYCGQTPWLQSMTIRENILFSSPYDASRYKQTLDACALTTDLANFKHGDLSPIGENGIGLSGGQKARVALARAVYSQSKILFLDDPLSALDQQTAESIVAKCLCGSLMKGRVVVLATHRTDICQNVADQLVEMIDGKALVVPVEVAAIESAKLQHSYALQNMDQNVSEEEEAAAIPEKFEEEEFRAHGGVQFRVYWEFVKAGRLPWWSGLVFSALGFRLLRIAKTWFLKEWGEAYDESGIFLVILQSYHETVVSISDPITRFFNSLPNPSVNPMPWLIWFGIISSLEAVVFLISDIFLLIITYFGGKRMFEDIMHHVTHATFRFYDITPIGRLLNRLTSDIGTIDGNISRQLFDFSWQFVAWGSSIVVIAGVTPLFVVFSLALTAVYIIIFLWFLPSSQSLRRLEMVSLSPLMSNFTALLDGLMTIRAFCVQSQFQDRVIAVTDTFQKMDHFYWSVQGWLMYRFDVLSGISTFILTVIAIFSGISPGLTAFVLSSASKFVMATHAICKQYGQLQLDFVSVERVVELLHLEQEPKGSINPPASWPRYGSDIIFEEATLRYASHLDPALSGISFKIRGGTNTAVIGRTGSGKSTMAVALLGTILPESGKILIDGIDISKVNKEVLRSRITFLAQDPVLFSGTLRHNLDPTEDHSDAACEAVIARVCGNYNWTLNTPVDAGGKNLSQGQRQLVGLARAILRRSAVVIMDEATASIDRETAWEIQRVVREEMRESTVIVIAHRPSAVRDAELCVALDKGRVLATGTPEEVQQKIGLAGVSESSI